MPRQVPPRLRTLRSGIVGETHAEFEARQWKTIEELNYRRAADYMHAYLAAEDAEACPEPVFIPLPARVPMQVVADLANAMRADAPAPAPAPAPSICHCSVCSPVEAEFKECKCSNCARHCADLDARVAAQKTATGRLRSGEGVSTRLLYAGLDAPLAPSVFIRAHDFRYREREECTSLRCGERWNTRERIIAFAEQHVQLGEEHDHSDPRVNGALCFSCLLCARHFIYPSTYNTLWLDYLITFESSASTRVLVRGHWGPSIDAL